MTREEALLHYYDNYVNEALEKNKEKFLKTFEENKLWIKEIVISSTRKISEAVSAKQLDSSYDTMYINFSLLRTSVINKQYKVLISAYNRNWYLDEDPTHMTISFYPILSVVDELREYLEEKRKIYVNKIENFHINEIVLKQVFEYFTHMELFVTTFLQDLDDERWFQSLNKTEEFFIRWGEYRDLTHIVYKFDKKEKNQSDFEKLIIQQQENDEELIFSSWQNLSFENIGCFEKNLMFSNFKRSTLENSEFIGSTLLGVNFKESKLLNCDFSRSLLDNANFNNSTLEKVTFKNSILKNADFTYVNLKEVDFEDCDLTGAKFLKKDIPFIGLSPWQLQTIIIEEA
ncbi:hypothetical protein J2Z44_001681 [Clostridium punense]|uniref:Pentapeptide repeat-containing protein n=1 Tax=Clostridium punense TaxID=1054297 RepID=A0ABS4K3Q3_9CLOT|nr:MULTISPECIES: pentapeptide repeat-containing protein [Clostridium]EQB90141.1 hypothetical protein M918_01275 [Clostridium sp. BL8]MBP2021885.1 hypothetical protein [Clostridium punense]